MDNPTVHPCSGFRLGVREWRAVVRPCELTHEHSCAVLENHRAEKKRTRTDSFRNAEQRHGCYAAQVRRSAERAPADERSDEIGAERRWRGARSACPPRSEATR